MPLTGVAYLPGVILQSDGLHSPGLHGTPFLSVQAVLSVQSALQVPAACALPTHALVSQAWEHCELSLQSLAQAFSQDEAIFAFPPLRQHFSPAMALFPIAIAIVKANAVTIRKAYLFKLISFLKFIMFRYKIRDIARYQIRSTVEAILGSTPRDGIGSPNFAFSAVISINSSGAVVITKLSGLRYIERFGPSAIICGSREKHFCSQFFFPLRSSVLFVLTRFWMNFCMWQPPWLLSLQWLTGCGDSCWPQQLVEGNGSVEQSLAPLKQHSG